MKKTNVTTKKKFRDFLQEVFVQSKKARKNPTVYVTPEGFKYLRLRGFIYKSAGGNRWGCDINYVFVEVIGNIGRSSGISLNGWETCYGEDGEFDFASNWLAAVYGAIDAFPGQHAGGLTKLEYMATQIAAGLATALKDDGTTAEYEHLADTAVSIAEELLLSLAE